MTQGADPRDNLLAGASMAAARLPVAMTAIGWEPVRGRKRMTQGWEPAAGWQLKPPPSAEGIRAMIERGATAYLYRLPEHVWVIDADNEAAVIWCTAVLGTPAVRTPRGAHWLVRSVARPVLPANAPPGIDTEPRQLYGPGSFYQIPGRGLVGYSGTVPDMASVPDAPAAWRVAPVRPDIAPAGQTFAPANAPQPLVAPADDWFGRPGAMSPAAAREKALAKLEAIRHGPVSGAGARGRIRDAALMLGGLLHTGWFDEAQACAQLEAACADRWGAVDTADETWIAQGLADGQRKPILIQDGAAVTAPVVDEHGQRVRRFPVLSGPQPPRAAVPMLVAGWVPDHALVRVFGAPGSLKSFVALDWALSVATGTPWLGQAVQQRSVLYVVAEGAYEFQRRIRAWLAAHQMSWPDTLHLIEAAPQMTDPADVEDLRLTVEELDCGLTINDTQARTTVGVNENDSKDAGVVQQAWDRIRGEKGTLVVVTHAGHGSDRARGSSAHLGAVDAEIRVNRPRKTELAATLSVAKMKDAPDDAVLHIAAQVVGLGDAVDGASLVLIAGTAPEGDRPPATSLVPDEPAYDAFAPHPVGPEIEAYRGHGAALVIPMSQTMAQRAPQGSSGLTLAEVKKLLGRAPKDGLAQHAWNVLWAAGALMTTPGSNRIGRGACWWVPPGEGRQAELLRRAMGP